MTEEQKKKLDNIKIKLKMYPSKNGDSFLLSIDTHETVNVLIDGGFASTFNDHILPDLNYLSSKNQALDLVIATHIDQDHILGLIEFFSQNGNSSNPKIIPVKNVFHNSVRSLTSEVSRVQRTDDIDLLNAINNIGFPINEEVSESQEISANQGSSLAALILKGGYKWNFSNGKKCINFEKYSSFNLSDKIQIQIISPSPNRLDNLKSWWLKELRRLGFIGEIGESIIYDDAFEFLSAQNDNNSQNTDLIEEISAKKEPSLDEAYSSDNSPTNASSIAFIATIGAFRLLFLGDAWSEDIEDQIKNIKPEDGRMMFDMIKISHHGSVHNTSKELLELIDSPKFFISTNGSGHGHPDIAVLKEIVDRECEFERHLFFSYSTPESIRMKLYQSKTNTKFHVHEGANDWVNIGNKK